MEPPPSGVERSDEPSGGTYHRGRDRVSGWFASVAVVVALVTAVLRWRPFRVEIEGASMIPVLMPGDWALAVVTRRLRRLDVVVVEHPGRPGYEMVKRLVGMPGDRVEGDRLLGPDEYWVEGDHAAGSTDSRQFGSVRRGAIVAKVLLTYMPKERRRLL